MKLKEIILISAMTIFSSNTSKIENKINGNFIVTPSKFEYPSFPKATIINETKKDTIELQGNMAGQIQYSLEPGQYLIKIEPGRDSISQVPGDKFPPYQTNIKIPSKTYLELTPISNKISKK